MNNMNNSLVTPRIRRARVATFAGFMILGAMMYIWSTGVSAFRHHMGLNGDLGDANFGMIAFGIGVGSAVGSFIVGMFLDRFGAKKVILTTAIAYPLSIIPMGYATDVYFALSFGVVLGLLRGAADTAYNTHGVQVERFYQRSIMTTFHAAYSLGGFVLGMVGSGFAARYTESAAVPFTVLGVLLLAIGIISSVFMLDQHEVVSEAATDAKGAKPASSASLGVIALMVGFGILLLGSMVGEGAVADWGQEYGRRVLGVTAADAGVAVSVFIGAQFIGRVIGDRLAALIGAVRLVFLSAVIAIAGLILIVVVNTEFAGLVGFAMFGLGLASIAPLMLSSAGRKDPANAGRNIGIVNCIGYSGMLIGPAAIALVVSTFGIDKLLYFPIVLLIPLAVFGPALMKQGRSSNSSLQTPISEHKVS
ncbi:MULTISPECIES: MFS transporter [unclassified Pseudomonas]|uniref:MFS transporter n=1 Tax=unclassified Pseudomonas TaxID=196821 RepID=UPI001AE8B499|nr:MULTISPECIES: MFS transporter [unclassified Pseudomonas]MBP2272730.1 MFS family permease [Pseudomonas sp. BP6]MBP2288299.1 MFS family permease [Pseudomonas sp. BP7]HDS1699028.1 MFS transporter [Pseudomonas putida]HDS1704162.1 MFS transporter [Pseudomonas putida]